MLTAEQQGMAILVWMVCVALAFIVGIVRGRAMEGILAGFLLGPVGLLWILATGNKSFCPFCKKRIDSSASVCAYCQRDLPQDAMA